MTKTIVMYDAIHNRWGVPNKVKNEHVFSPHRIRLGKNRMSQGTKTIKTTWNVSAIIKGITPL